MRFTSLTAYYTILRVTSWTRHPLPIPAMPRLRRRLEISALSRATRAGVSRLGETVSSFASSLSDAGHNRGVKWGLDIEAIEYPSQRSSYRRHSSQSSQKSETASQPTPTNAAPSAFEASGSTDQDDKYDEGGGEGWGEKDPSRETAPAEEPPESRWGWRRGRENDDPGGISVSSPEWRNGSRNGSVEDDIVSVSPVSSQDQVGEARRLLSTAGQVNSNLSSFDDDDEVEEDDFDFGVNSLPSLPDTAAGSQYHDDSPVPSPKFAPTIGLEQSQFIFPAPPTVPPSTAASDDKDSHSLAPSV